MDNGNNYFGIMEVDVTISQINLWRNNDSM